MSGKSLTFGPSDRDAQGRIAAERSLADMLPAAEPAAPSPSAAPGARVKTAQLTALAFVGMAVLIALFALVRPGATPIAAPSATPTAAQPTSPQQQPAAAPATAPSPTPACTLLQTTATFYAPGGAPAPIAAERGQACQVLAWHAGYPDWRQIRIDGGSPVWVPVAVLSTAARSGPDLAPPPTATPAPAPPTAVVIVERVVVTAVPCDTPRYTARLDTIVDGIPIGYVIGESCGSQAEADARAATLREQAEAAYRATHSPTPTPQPDLGSASYQATDMAIVSRLHDSPTPTRRPL